MAGDEGREDRTVGRPGEGGPAAGGQPAGEQAQGPAHAAAEGAEAAAQHAEDEHDAGLKAVLSSALVAGPDPGVVDEVIAAADSADETQVANAHAEEQVRRIYEDILTRAPEHDVQPSLERVAAVLELLGEPHRAAPVIHITGTNGKTSTARMVERLLRERGLRTGRFTSPHLHSVRERIAIDGEPISPQAFVSAWEEVAPFVAMVDERSQQAGGPRLSFFEVFTVMAFAAFADAPVDVVVLEVGMGGRWDATNVADGTVEIITPISRDHVRWLGHDLTSIADEKAGIITDASTVVVGTQPEEVGALIASVCAQHRARMISDGAELAVLDRQLGVGGQMITLRTPAATYTDVFLPLHGEHQAHNALLALAAVEAFFGGGALPAQVVEHGFAAVDSPGRLEVVRTSPTVLVDGAHNAGGAEALRAAVDEAFSFTHLVGVVGVMGDKDAEAILSELEPLLDEVVITRVQPSERSMDVEELAEIAVDVFGEDRVSVAEPLTEALDQAVAKAESHPEEPMASVGVLVTGSVLLAAEARALLRRPNV